MATANSISNSTSPPAQPVADLLVYLASMPPEQLENILGKLTDSFPAESLLISTPDELTASANPALRIVTTPASAGSWTLTASDFVTVYQLAQKNGARSILMLGPESASLTATSIRDLSRAIIASPGQTDLVIPCYDLPARAGLVNSSILYPLTRALFASRPRYPLAVDLGLSLRMAERLAAAGQKSPLPIKALPSSGPSTKPRQPVFRSMKSMSEPAFCRSRQSRI